jgi:hypothetical protein
MTIQNTFIHKLALAVGVVPTLVLVSTAIAGAPLSANNPVPPTSIAPNQVAEAEMAPPMETKHSSDHRVEARIADLRKRLQVTADQESLWVDVGAVMRENEHKMHESIVRRSSMAKNMNAIDDLKSYQQITDEHSDGLKRLIPVFEALYAKMTPAQQRNADHVFDQGQRRGQKAL